MDAASLAHDGTLLLFGAGRSDSLQFALLDRRGRHVSQIGRPWAGSGYGTLSPDGQWVAAFGPGRSEETSDIWLHRVGASESKRVTFGPGSKGFPIWKPNGKEITFLWRDSPREPGDIGSQTIDATDAPTRLVSTTAHEYPDDWSPSGDVLLYSVQAGDSLYDIRYLQANQGEGGYTDHVYLASPSNEQVPQFSPDGDWVAYASDKSGAFEVYVGRFPPDGFQRQISVRGGTQPRWDPAGGALFYVHEDTLMRVSVETTGALTVGEPEALFARASLAVRPRRPRYDVMPGGEQFVVLEASTLQPSLKLTQNWYEEFRDRK